MATGPNKTLLLKYVLQDCTSEEIIFVESWIKNDAEIKKQIDQLKLLYQTDKEIIAKYSSIDYQFHPKLISIEDLKNEVDEVFIALHGRPGEDGTLQQV